MKPRKARPHTFWRERPIRSTLLLAAVITALGCTNDSSPATTQPPGPGPESPPPVPSFTISGIVFEHTADGRRPAAGVALRVLSADAIVTSDSVGRFSASVRGDLVIIAPVESAAYVAPCPAGTDWLSANPNQTFEVNVVSRAVLSTTGVPNSYPKSAIFVEGTVVETALGQKRPVAGALISLGSEPYNATTLTDALGRYLVCTAPPGVGTDQLMPLNVAKDGYLADSRLVLGGGWDNPVNVELLRTR